MADPARARKVADRTKVVVAEYLEHRVKDERLGFITITDVRVTGDMQHASIFYTAYGSAQEQADTAAALESAKGKIRSAVGGQLGIRLTPSIEFIPDALPEGAAHLEDVLLEVQAADAELARSREGAMYAGDADPYKKPATERDGSESDEVGGPDGSTSDEHGGSDESDESDEEEVSSGGLRGTVSGDLERDPADVRFDRG